MVASDEWRDRDVRRRPRVRADGLPDPDRLLTAPNLDRTDVVDLDAPDRQPVHARADQDLAGFGDLLEARGQIDRLAGGERGVAGTGDHFPRLDPDACLKLEVLDRVEDLQRGADGALGIVLVCRRDAECSHHGVTRELLDGAAVGLDTA